MEYSGILNDDCMRLICEKLSIKDVVTLTKVNSHFRRIAIAHLANVYRKLKIESANLKSSLKIFHLTFTMQSKLQIEIDALQVMGAADKAAFMTALPQMKCLEDLTLEATLMTRKRKMGKIKFQPIFDALKGLENLKMLTIRAPYDSRFLNGLNQFKNLEMLHTNCNMALKNWISFFNNNPKLSALGLDTQISQELLKILPNNLIALELQAMPFSALTMSPFQLKFRELQTLNLTTNINPFKDRFTLSILKCLSVKENGLNLRNLSMTNWRILSDSECLAISRITSLRKLDCNKVSKIGLGYFSQLDELEVLMFEHIKSENLSPELLNIIRNCKNIGEIRVSPGWEFEQFFRDALTILKERNGPKLIFKSSSGFPNISDELASDIANYIDIQKNE